MPVRRTSDSSALSEPSAALRVLRVRASAASRALFPLPNQGQPYTVEVVTREPVREGEGVVLEVSFGPLADEVALEARVEAVRLDPARVVVRIDPDHLPRIRYVRAVLEGRRPASARTHRRIAVDLEVRWSTFDVVHASRLRDLSRGGAFIVSKVVPRVGTPLDIEIHTADGALTLPAVVSWTRGQTEPLGFGVSFKLPDRNAAARLTEVVRQHDAAPR